MKRSLTDEGFEQVKHFSVFQPQSTETASPITLQHTPLAGYTQIDIYSLQLQLIFNEY